MVLYKEVKNQKIWDFKDSNLDRSVTVGNGYIIMELVISDFCGVHKVKVVCKNTGLEIYLGNKLICEGVRVDVTWEDVLGEYMVVDGVIKDSAVYSREIVSEAVRRSKEHWERMLEWVEKNKDCCDRQELREHMIEDLGECWYCADCILCSLFHKHVPHDVYNACSEKCPLVEVGECCLQSKSVWRAVERSKTIEGWIKGAQKMIKLLEEILERGC